jgi:hypothetical protein
MADENVHWCSHFKYTFAFKSPLHNCRKIDIAFALIVVGVREAELQICHLLLQCVSTGRLLDMNVRYIHPIIDRVRHHRRSRSDPDSSGHIALVFRVIRTVGVSRELSKRGSQWDDVTLGPKHSQASERLDAAQEQEHRYQLVGCGCSWTSLRCLAL